MEERNSQQSPVLGMRSDADLVDHAAIQERMMKHIGLIAAAILSTTPAMAEFCKDPAGKTWEMKSSTSSATVNGKDYKCTTMTTGDSTGRGKYSEAWTCEGIKIIITRDGLLTSLDRVMARRSYFVDYKLIDKAGQSFSTSEMYDWDARPENGPCIVSFDGKTATRSTTETASNDTLRITLKRDYSYALKDLPRPSL